MAAAPVALTAVEPGGLALGVEGVDVHGVVQAVAHCLDVVPAELVGLVDALRVPVRPVQFVLKHRQGKRVGQA